MRLMLIGFLVFGLTSHLSFAEEGMWPPEQLPELSDRLRQLGLEIETERLTSLIDHPMNAVVSLGGCTASFVSPQGLIVTNHHCAYSSIQHNSTSDENLLEKGFLAQSDDQELAAAPGSRVLVTVEFRDVTVPILGDLPNNLAGQDRFAEIDRRSKNIVADCEKQPNHRCRVASYHGGLRYSLVRQLELRDLRLVYAPASGIGVFGGDTDNWMWPRHTGDFAFYRAYVDPNGQAADYHPDNVPYQPNHYLRVSPGGLQKGDLVLVAGYPGRTERYRLSSEVEDSFGWRYPRRIETFQQWLQVIRQATEGRSDAALKYASLTASLNNALKNNQGMLDGFAKSNMLQKKRMLESQLLDWIASDPVRNADFGSSLSRLQDELERIRATGERDFYYAAATRSSLLTAARRIFRLAVEREKPDLQREAGFQEMDWSRIKQSLERLDRTLDPEVDRSIWLHFIKSYHQLPDKARVGAVDNWFNLKPGEQVGRRLENQLSKMYRETKLTDLQQRLALMDSSKEDLERSRDPFIRLAVHLFETDTLFEQEDKEQTGNLQLLRPRYMRAVIAFQKEQGQPVYPDANSTLRVTFGTVEGYQPRDGVEYHPFTTLEGVVEKDTGQDPFRTPSAILDLMQEKKYGAWASPELGTVPVNFLSTCDSTGGNSGSPTLNAKGELVGLLFDGNYEAMIADWDFLPEVTRSIHVDIRYVLWVMDQADNAHHLLREMGVVSQLAHSEQ